ncbi:phosphate transport system substrate-binding protein [Aequitasia blattaphilus]|uniref:Substrate-binding domain-containing protein n=1 Tax=Aequitasia blattaphilus TaxID=2949332 RepID=A0ABT1E7Y7_9FIRM|nr:substrate-binding domain-containing protein [Aequitasia blattaphilus]MCP1101944.1 substrate-binding domain-containing protein [Aequitasia blattaphilus]MCR8614584.1 substrate-binding domain-containing protein [Aequitasia blattaphilus]
MKRKTYLIISLLIALVFLSGCGQSEKFDSSNDITIVSREEGSGTRGAFVELLNVVQKKKNKDIDMITLEAQITNSTAVTMTTVAEDEYAIGYISLGSMNSQVKALEVDGVPISEANIVSGDYKISRPFNIVTKEGTENPAREDFIRFVLSEQGQKVVGEAGYIPLKDTVPYKPQTVKGKVVVGGSSSVAPVMEKMIEAYQRVNKGAQVELQATDSTTGATAVTEGGYDIGMLSREVKDSEKKQGLVPQVMAIDGIAIIVNQLNDIDGLSSDAIREVYLGNDLTWDEVMK